MGGMDLMEIRLILAQQSWNLADISLEPCLVGEKCNKKVDDTIPLKGKAKM